jgi:hypothetical protein
LYPQSMQHTSRAAGLVTKDVSEYIPRLKELNEEYRRRMELYYRNTLEFEHEGMDWNRAVFTYGRMDKRTRAARELRARLDEAQEPRSQANKARTRVQNIYDHELTPAEQQRVRDEGIPVVEQILSSRERLERSMRLEEELRSL